MTKRERLDRLLGTADRWDYVPAAFFMHFGERYVSGQAAIDRHLEYFRATDMDFLKIQYEKTFPRNPAIAKPEDWSGAPMPGPDFYAETLHVLKHSIAAAKPGAYVLMTLYSPYMCAGHMASDALLASHLNEAPDSVLPAMERITESLMLFVRECVKLGVDGFYMSTQGGEAGRYAKPGTFEKYVKPFDLRLMERAQEACAFNILHVCDHHKRYGSVEAFTDYPGHAVNLPFSLADGSTVSPAESYARFRRPVMGGLDKKGALGHGDAAAIQAEVRSALRDRPPRFILGADCTIAGTTPWEHVKLAIDLAHNS